jgi:hypothetical protein
MLKERVFLGMPRSTASSIDKAPESIEGHAAGGLRGASNVHQCHLIHGPASYTHVDMKNALFRVLIF